jgi:competence protein ComEC
MPLKVHFLNVGRGDCTIIEFPSGRVGMVDVYNLKVFDPDTGEELLQESRDTLEKIADEYGYSLEVIEQLFIEKAQENLTDPLEYYAKNIGKYQDIFRLIITHPDMDHMTGLYRLHEQESLKDIVNFWHTGSEDFNLADTNWSESPYDERDWKTYKKLRESTDTPKAMKRERNDTGDFWTEDGIEIWAPTPELKSLAVEKDKPNILSMVLKISYQDRSIVLGGDATSDETWPEIWPVTYMKNIDVFKASHHGRKSGYYMQAVREMSPGLTITSVGNERKHDATENYRRYSDYTVSLRKSGSISITIEDDGSISYSPNIKENWKPKKT